MKSFKIGEGSSMERMGSGFFAFLYVYAEQLIAMIKIAISESVN